jgi:5-methylcytosine-specific restriction endonuclease McrA
LPIEDELNEFILPPKLFMEQFKKLNPELWNEWELKWAREKEQTKIRTDKWKKDNKTKWRNWVRKYNKRPYVKEKNSVRKHKRRTIKSNCNGSHTIQEWLDKKAQYNDRCAYCGKNKPLTKDHIIPLSKGGSNNIGNIVPACMGCNRRKFTNHKDLQLVF